MRTRDSQQHRPCWRLVGPAGSRLHHGHPSLGPREPQARGRSSEVRRGDLAVSWRPGPQLLGGSVMSLLGTASSCLEPPGRAPSGRAQLGTRGFCLGPSSSSHCGPQGPSFPPRSGWNRPGFWTLVQQQESRQESICCFCPLAATARPPSPASHHPFPGIAQWLFSCLLAGAALSLLTALLSLGDSNSRAWAPRVRGPSPVGSPRVPCPGPGQPFMVRAALLR